jgi:hypothetical protein
MQQAVPTEVFGVTALKPVTNQSSPEGLLQGKTVVEEGI